MIVYLGSFLLLLIGLYAVVTKKSLAQIIIGLVIMEMAADLLLVAMGEKGGATVIISLATVIVFVALVNRLGSFDVFNLRGLKG